jgi:hypothetical protein
MASWTASVRWAGSTSSPPAANLPGSAQRRPPDTPADRGNRFRWECRLNTCRPALAAFAVAWPCGRVVKFRSARCVRRAVRRPDDLTARRHVWLRCGVPRAVEHMHNKPHMRVTATSMGRGHRRPGGRFPLYPRPPGSLWATHKCPQTTGAPRRRNFPPSKLNGAI